MNASEPVALFGGADPRCDELLKALLVTIHERAAGMPIPLIVGTLAILQHELIRDHGA